MVILGNVRKLHNLMAEIELPGRVYGLLSISAVSNTFTRQLQKQLQTSEVEDDKDVSGCIKRLINIIICFYSFSYATFSKSDSMYQCERSKLKKLRKNG